MIHVLSDEEYIVFSSFKTKNSLLESIKMLLIEDYILEVLENGYIHIVNKNTRALQWRRKFAPRVKLYIPKYLFKIKVKQ